MTDENLRRRVEALEARLGDLEDERAIRELLARYGYHADGCRDQAWLDLWSDDGTYDLTIATWTGKDQLRAFIEDPEVHHRPGFYGHTLHLQGGNLVVRVDGDAASATSYNVLFLDAEEGNRTVRIGMNRWLFRREDGRWRILERLHRGVGEPDFADELPA